MVDDDKTPPIPDEEPPKPDFPPQPIPVDPEQKPDGPPLPDIVEPLDIDTSSTAWGTKTEIPIEIIKKVLEKNQSNVPDEYLPKPLDIDTTRGGNKGFGTQVK